MWVGGVGEGCGGKVETTVLEQQLKKKKELRIKQRSMPDIVQGLFDL